MAVNFDSFKFGEVVINGRPYRDVIVIGDKVEPRDESRLNREVGGHHFIGDWEVEKLLSTHPEIVIVAAGTAGIVEVSPEIRRKFEKAKTKLIVLNTPEAIQKYEQLTLENKKVNILVHVTC